ncbi:hypothetical protein OESDEN_23959, partial [Oesophagostomum dentatum]
GTVAYFRLHSEGNNARSDQKGICFEIIGASVFLYQFECKYYPAGMWDELVVTFVFERRYMWYFLQAYLPTYFTIFISWLAFSLGPEAITPRTMLGVNALLSMIFHFGSIMRNLPRVSYIKAI